MDAVDLLHHGYPSTWAGVKSATLGTKDQSQTNYSFNDCNRINNILVNGFISIKYVTYGIAAETLQSEVHSEVIKAYEAPTDVPVVDISVQFDGSWLTHGHTSLIGIACVINILTGNVFDFEVMCKVCRNCSEAKRELGESSAEYDIWFEDHRNDCDINHSGSSTSMEMEAALIIWEKSQEMGFRYSTLLSDEDCKTFNYLTEKMCIGINLK
ncbi:uncharacterized protein TNCV_3775421 [Trichonephila clavipes]|nr:uncharacterized protein TNCV_3775421 [Trichonephila clavipes]